MTLSMIGGHFTENGIGANYPSRVCLSIQGNGLGEQHPDTIVLFRDVTVYNDGPPDLHTHPQRRTIEFARWWYQEIREVEDKPCLREVWIENRDRADFFVITNELGGSNPEHIQDHIAYEANICQLAHADGLKCAVGKLAGDSPDWDTNLWEELYAPHIMSMWDRYGAVYARHVYGGNLIDSNGNPTDDPPGNPQRAIFEAYHLRSLGYGGGMVLAECGIDGGYGVADYGRFQTQVLGYEAALRPYADVIIGLCWWECGLSGFEANYTGHLMDLRSLLDTSLPKWEGKEMSDKPKIVIVKKPSKDSMTQAENEAANDYAWNNYGRTTTHSHDDMLTMLGAGNDESYAVVCWPERQPNTVTMLESAGYDWIMFPEEVPPVAWTSVNVPHMPQFGGGADARSNDCGAAAVAMVVNGQTANRPTVDQVAIAYQSPANSYMNFSQLDTALNGYGMDGIRKQPYTPPQISTDIVSGKAVIALVWYQSLAIKFNLPSGQPFNGSHFIAIYATNKNGLLRYRDPIAPDGRTLEITYDVLEKAMRDAQNTAGNAPNQGMVCSVKSSPPPAQTVNVLQYLRGNDGQQFDKEYIVNGRSGTQTTMIKHLGPYEWLYVKGTNGEYEHFWVQLWNGQDWIFRADDTSESADRMYAHYMSNGGALGAPWVPVVMEVSKVYQTSKFVQHYAKADCSKLNSGNVTDSIKLNSLPYNRTYQSNKTEKVITLQWASGEEYDFAERGGNIGFRKPNEDFWFMGWLEGRAPLTYKKYGCLGW